MSTRACRLAVARSAGLLSLAAVCVSACGGSGAEPPPTVVERSPAAVSAEPKFATQPPAHPDSTHASSQPPRPADPRSGEQSSARYSRAFAAAFARVTDSVRAATRVPLRVPRLAFGDAADDSVRITILAAAPEQYDLVIGDGSVDYCTGGVYCRVGEVTGERLRAGVAPPAGRQVTLPGGRHGVFTAATCGANCSDSRITWDEGPYRYVLGLKLGTLPEVLRMAESALLVP